MSKQNVKLFRANTPRLFEHFGNGIVVLFFFIIWWFGLTCCVCNVYAAHWRFCLLLRAAVRGATWLCATLSLEWQGRVDSKYEVTS